jgi:hypothetical protein
MPQKQVHLFQEQFHPSSIYYSYLEEYNDLGGSGFGDYTTKHLTSNLAFEG